MHDAKQPNAGYLSALIAPAMLAVAWQKVFSNRGSAGGDGVTLRRFQAGLSAELESLRQDLAGGAYQRRPYRKIEIPKAKGGTRALMVPSVRDRVVDTAITSLLLPILEPQFEDGSFAYRPGRSVRQAVARIEMWRNRGYEHVIEADIIRYFDNIQHALLMRKLQAALADTGQEEILSLIEEVVKHQGQALETPGKGLVQGSPLSPILANLYLDALDEALDGRGVKIVRFADDFVILCKTGRKAEAALDLARSVLGEHGLELHDDGTRIVSFDQGFDFIGYLFLRTLALKKAATPSRMETASRGDVPLGGTEAGEEQRDEQLAEQDDERSVKLPFEYDRGDRVLYLTDDSRRLSLRNESFSVLTGAGEEVAAISHSRVDRIEVGPSVRLDWDVLDHCLATDTDIVFVDGYGVRKAQLAKPAVHAGALHLSQAGVILDGPLRCCFARKLVEARIRNQRTQLFRLNRSADLEEVDQALKAMGRNLRKISGGGTLDQLRGYEGASGALYWPALGRLTRGAPRPFKRSRPAADPLNAAVNYLTAILERDIRAALLAADLHVGFGLLHSARDGNEAAVYDLMEPFRAPLTEGLAVYLFNARRLRADMFQAGNAIAVRMDRDACHVIIKAYEQAVAKRVNITARKGKLAWRPMMRRQARDLAKAFRAADPELFQPYLMEA